MTRSIVFYISGHGLGHASRDIEVINALLDRRPDLLIAIRTSAPRWLFDLTLRGRADLYEIECDTGVVQIDSLRLDEAETIRQAAAFHDELETKAALEAQWLRDAGAALVIGDIPPLAFAAAGRAGVPSIALGNFTWDWIYEGYPERLAAAPRMLESIREAYACADCAWRLPLAGGFEPFGRVVDLPFIARRSRRDPLEVRRALGFDVDCAVVLVSFGGYGLRRVDLESAGTHRTHVVLVTDDSPAWAQPRAGIIQLDERRLYESGYRYEDLVAASDAVVTKPGYGIISECIANRTAVLYTSRGRFREYEVLVDGMRRFVRCEFIGHDDLLAGRWDEYLSRLFASPPPVEQPPTNGAEVGAGMILDLLKH